MVEAEEHVDEVAHSFSQVHSVVEVAADLAVVAVVSEAEVVVPAGEAAQAEVGNVHDDLTICTKS